VPRPVQTPPGAGEAKLGATGGQPS